MGSADSLTPFSLPRTAASNCPAIARDTDCPQPEVPSPEWATAVKNRRGPAIPRRYPARLAQELLDQAA